MAHTHTPQLFDIVRLREDGTGVAVKRGTNISQTMSHVLPGERVSLAPQITVLDPSPERTVPHCPHLTSCGGCSLGHASSGFQKSFKIDLVSAATATPPGSMDWIASPPVGYRNRARLAFAGGDLGYRARGSRKVATIASCAVLESQLTALLPHLGAMVKLLSGEGELHLASSTPLPTIAIFCAAPQSADVYRRLDEWVGSIVSGFELHVGWEAGPSRGDKANKAIAPYRGGAPVEVSIAADGSEYPVPIGEFRQANTSINVQIGEWLTSRLSSAQNVAELFAGSGNFTRVLLKSEPRQLSAVEIEPAAAEQWLRGIKPLYPDARVTVADAGRMRLPLPTEVVLVDPPRDGLKHPLSRALLEHPRLAEIFYISCSPQTLAKDLKVLCEESHPKRFAVVAVAAADMFPQTHHVETVVHLKRPWPTE